MTNTEKLIKDILHLLTFSGCKSEVPSTNRQLDHASTSPYRPNAANNFIQSDQSDTAERAPIIAQDTTEITQNDKLDISSNDLSRQPSSSATNVINNNITINVGQGSPEKNCDENLPRDNDQKTSETYVEVRLDNT